MLIQQFRKTVYQSFCKRADAMIDLVDALTVAGHVNSPVALSEETPFRRKFSSIFDTLLHGEIEFDHLLPALFEYQPGNSEQIAGYELYALDCTPNEREEAETLEDRGSLKTQKDEPVRYGHKYSWLVRLVEWGTSWVAPVDVRRVETSLTDSQVGSVQVKNWTTQSKAKSGSRRQPVWQSSVPGGLSGTPKHIMPWYGYAATWCFTNAPSRM